MVILRNILVLMLLSSHSVHNVYIPAPARAPCPSPAPAPTPLLLLLLLSCSCSCSFSCSCSCSCFCSCLPPPAQFSHNIDCALSLGRLNPPSTWVGEICLYLSSFRSFRSFSSFYLTVNSVLEPDSPLLKTGGRGFPDTTISCLAEREGGREGEGEKLSGGYVERTRLHVWAWSKFGGPPVPCILDIFIAHSFLFDW